jgi:XTP/dITP diphosphohydrolase
MTIWFASGNVHKKKELAEILSGFGSHDSVPGVCNITHNTCFNLKIPADADLSFNPDETGNSFRENALIKAHELHKLLCEKKLFHVGDAVIADDSGICVDALDGRPGIYSARYAGTPGRETNVSLNDTDRNTLLLAELDGLSRRNARFVCAITLLFNTDNYYIAQETLEGYITESPGGSGGFGYDPVLFIPELGRTVAELSAEEKNRISHRGKAVRVIAGIIRDRK